MVVNEKIKDSKNRLSWIVRKSKELKNLHLVNSKTFEELKGMIPILNGKLWENDIPDEMSNFFEGTINEIVCSYCKPKFPIIEMPYHFKFSSQGCTDGSYFFANPPSFSSFEFYLTINIQKDIILKKVEDLYNLIKNSDKRGIIRKFDGWSNNISKIIEIYGKYNKKTKREFQIEIINLDGSKNYRVNLCRKCEKDILEKIKKDSINAYKKGLYKLGLRKSDYNLSLRIKKKTIW